ncbi:MAG: GNAT family N-acetyltransferase [Actinobacteria bacterium HGW-Actinobacteria-2]|nr:MAG: GNAT family N-acetyltransferase [Actinobacteria bacterium HGW-Actinobacteria-2]
MALIDLSWPRHTRRLTLRPFEAEDVAALWAWQRLPEVTYWMPRLSDDIDKFTAHLLAVKDRTLVGLIDEQPVVSAKVDVQDAWAQEEATDQAAGTMAEIGWAVDPAWQGKGLGTELAAELLTICFQELHLHRVVAECFAENAPSAAIMERVGMRREAHHVADALHRDGTWRDSFIYAVLAHEWTASKTARPID